jgi:hypothetical protein
MRWAVFFVSFIPVLGQALTVGVTGGVNAANSFSETLPDASLTAFDGAVCRWAIGRFSRGRPGADRGRCAVPTVYCDRNARQPELAEF